MKILHHFIYKRGKFELLYLQGVVESFNYSFVISMRKNLILHINIIMGIRVH